MTELYYCISCSELIETDKCTKPECASQNKVKAPFDVVEQIN